MYEIGKRIRELRKQRNWPLEELSKRSGLSVSFLSQAERDQTSLAITSLKSIADALETPIQHFFPMPENVPSVVPAEETRWLQIEDSKVRYGFLSGLSERKVLEPLLVEYPPCYEGPPPFSHDGEEFGYILEGQVTLLLDDKTFELKAGDSFHYRSRRSHAMTNPGKVPAKILFVLTPRINKPEGGNHGL